MFKWRSLLQKPVTILAGVGLLTAAALGWAGFALAGPGSPGSASDPLVSRSFVEKYVQDYVNKNGSGPAAPIYPATPSMPVQTAAGAAESSWVILELAAGDEFIGRSGTEFIIRSGAAQVLDPSGSGIPDLTAGSNVLAGQTAGNNHLFLIPKADGRGIRAAKATIVMYRG